jgi:hypothetical protein
MQRYNTHTKKKRMLTKTQRRREERRACYRSYDADLCEDYLRCTPREGAGGPRDVYVKKRAMVVAVIAVIAALCIDYLFRPFPTFLGSSPCTT